MDPESFVSFGSISSARFLSGYNGENELSRRNIDEFSDRSSLPNVRETKSRAKGLFEDLDDDVLSEHAGADAGTDATISAENALFEITQDLRNDFYRGLSIYADQNDIVQMVRHFETACEEQYFKLAKHRKSAGRGSKELDINSILRLLKAEKLAWRWLWTLVECRQVNLTKNKPREPLSDWMSNSDVFRYMLKFDDKFLELRALVRCLENEAAEWINDNILSDHKDKIDFLWTNTRDCLRRNEKNLGKLLVNELDPDAPFRQERSLKDVDAVNQEDVFKSVFTLIRVGHIDEAIRLSQRQGTQWLAAVLAGGRLSDGADGSHSPSENGFAEEGEVDRKLWNKICASVAKEVSVSPIERAIYGAISGFLPATLLGCSTWEDHLWAYASASCEKLLVDFLALVRTKAHVEIQNFLDNGSFAEQREMFQRFILHCAENFSDEGDIAPYRLVPLFFNLEAYDKLLAVLTSWKRFVQPHEQILLWKNLHRFVCHVAIVLRLIYSANITSPTRDRRSEHAELGKIGSPFLFNYCLLPDCVAAVQDYLDQLAEDKEILLFPHYAIFLPDDRHIGYVASFLEGIASDEDRKLCLSIIESCELNVLEICRTVVKNVVERLLPSPCLTASHLFKPGESDPRPTSESDRKVIRSLLFLRSIPDLRFDAISQACLMARRFMLVQKFDAAGEVFSFIPMDMVESAAKPTSSSHRDDAAWQNRVREYCCLREYSNAHVAFRDWSDMFFNHKPKESALTSVYDVTMSTSRRQQAEREHSQAMERWRADTTTYFEVAELSMRQILIYTDGEWLVDPCEDDDALRRREMIALRKRCIPMVADMLLFMYQTMKQYDKALALTEVLMDESGKLYQLFEKSTLETWFDQLINCSFQCLREGLDSLGFPYSQI